MIEIKVAILALGLIGLAFAIVLAFLSKKLKVEENPRVSKVLALLPGLNCGACGFSGCRVYAEAVVKECSIFNGCLPGGDKLNQKISETLGIVGCVLATKQIVVCKCQAETGQKKESSVYFGPKTCKAADMISGAIDCVYGCLAFGDCLGVCPTEALSLVNKRIKVDSKKCIGCGKCVESCPRNLFELIPAKKDTPIYYVACSNSETILGVKGVCDQGCIACSICVRVADSPYFLKNNLSSVNQEKALKEKSLKEGKDKCPTKCIFKLDA